MALDRGYIKVKPDPVPYPREKKNKRNNEAKRTNDFLGSTPVAVQPTTRKAFNIRDRHGFFPLQACSDSPIDHERNKLQVFDILVKIVIPSNSALPSRKEFALTQSLRISTISPQIRLIPLNSVELLHRRLHRKIRSLFSPRPFQRECDPGDAPFASTIGMESFEKPDDGIDEEDPEKDV
jgi:hypothetical protein